MTPPNKDEDEDENLEDKIKVWPLHEWSFTPPWSNDELMTKNREELAKLATERFMGDNKGMIDYLLGKNEKKDDDAK